MWPKKKLDFYSMLSKAQEWYLVISEVYFRSINENWPESSQFLLARYVYSAERSVNILWRLANDYSRTA